MNKFVSTIAAKAFRVEQFTGSDAPIKTQKSFDATGGKMENIHSWYVLLGSVVATVTHNAPVLKIYLSELDQDMKMSRLQISLRSVYSSTVDQVCIRYT